MEKRPRILISGGGTGGHIFPALSIADACRRRFGADILFVGAEGRMEMEKVPAAGYTIQALPVAGFNRKQPLKNFSVLVRLYKSLRKAKKILREFKPDIAIGVGGYASGPMLKEAQKAGIPTLIQEQNSYPGVTNKLLAPKARCVCVAYDGMEAYFPADKIVATGNPIRKNLTGTTLTPEEARKSFGLEADRPTLLVVGGSLGARTINETMQAIVGKLVESGIQVIWQTGKNYEGPKEARAFGAGEKSLVITPFVSDMAAAYSAATLVVSRAGAGTISELELLGKPCILVPSPNVAEDHQTKNARALSSRGAAILISDKDCREQLSGEISDTINNPGKLRKMHEAILSLALPDSDEKIADEIEKLL